VIVEIGVVSPDFQGIELVRITLEREAMPHQPLAVNQQFLGKLSNLAEVNLHYSKLIS